MGIFQSKGHRFTLVLISLIANFLIAQKYQNLDEFLTVTMIFDHCSIILTWVFDSSFFVDIVYKFHLSDSTMAIYDEIF